jgi:hypothetical protein
VVTVADGAPNSVILAAAECASHVDAPLLFLGSTPAQRRRVDATIESWSASAKDDFRIAIVGHGDAVACMDDHGRTASRLSVFDIRSGSRRQFDGIEAGKKLESLAVIAAPRSQRAEPDVAIGLALGAHLAVERGPVSLVIVPRFPQTDHAALAQLRKQHDVAREGVVLGQTGILSEDSRTLIREITASPRHQSGLVGAIGSGASQLGALVSAVLVLLGLQAAAPTTRKVLDGAAAGLGRGIENVPSIRSVWQNVRGGGENGGTTAVNNDNETSTLRSWVEAASGAPATVRLTGDRSLRGEVASRHPADALRITGVWVEGGTSSDVPVEMLVPLAHIVAIEKTADDGSPRESPTRRSSMRLATELLADIAGTGLSALDDVDRAIQTARKQFSGLKEPIRRHDLHDLLEEAIFVRDNELYAALRKLDDGIRLMNRDVRTADAVATDAFFDSLADVATTSARQVPWSVSAYGRRDARDKGLRLDKL